MATTQGNEPPKYWLKRNYKASIRLNYNHHLLKEAAGALFHPDVPAAQTGIRIADVGCGTAAWALEVAAKNPTVKVDAFDISDEQYSPLYGIKNVKLMVHDCFKPFSEEHIGQYDLVNARFWLCLVNNPDAPRLLSNIATLIKPGGYIQWFEPDVSHITVAKPDSGVDSPVMAQHVRLWQKPRPDSTYEWVDQLPDLFRAQGLENVAVSKHRMPDHVLAMWMQSQLAGIEETLDQEYQDIGHGEKILAYSNALQGEIKQGFAVDTPFTWVAGQKPA